MKLNAQLTTALAAISAFSFNAFAIELGNSNGNSDATAQVVWNGFVGNTVEGSNLIITGIGGGEIGSGTLFVEPDGTFTSSQVVLEAHDFDTDTQTVGERQPSASWTYVSSQVMVGGSVTDDADVEVVDALTNTTLTLGQPDQVQAGVLTLEIKNTQPLTDVSVEGQAQVSIQMAASYEQAL
ncbi:TPA: hypothetical protein I7671_04315 [Vibrio vulnificus]|nr:hypothetical protein [Vibrio vulnificus]